MEKIHEFVAEILTASYRTTGSIFLSIALASLLCLGVLLLFGKLSKENNLVAVGLKIILGSFVTEGIVCLSPKISTVLFGAELRVPGRIAAFGSFSLSMAAMALLMMGLQIFLDFHLEKKSEAFDIALDVFHAAVLIYECIFHPCGFILFYTLLVMMEYAKLFLKEYIEKKKEAPQTEA